MWPASDPRSWAGRVAGTRRAAAFLFAALAPLTLNAPALAQSGDPKPASIDSSLVLESYLSRPGLRTLLAEHLQARLKTATPEQKGAIGERLGKLYVEFIGAAKTPAERAVWEDRARELLKLVPEVKSYELRLDLSKSVYTRAEEAAERHRLRLGTDEDKAETERTLRTLKQQFESVGAEATRKIDALEKAEDAAKGTDKSETDLIESRRLRSIAYYYAGWSAYYLAYLSGSDAPAADAIKDFGWLLGAQPGRSAELARLPKGLLKYDHIARATIGCGLAYGLRREGDTEALRWFDAVESEQAITPEVRAQLSTRRIAVLGGAHRWADLDVLIRQMRGGDRNARAESSKPLEPLVARLLAVVCFEADRKFNAETIEQLGQIAMADLVARGEVGHVLDLAQKYGTNPLGDEGFIVHYVRGMQSFEKAVKLQKDGNENPDEPSTQPATINQFRQAAVLLETSVTQADAVKFPSERSRALVAAGRAFFRAGDMTAAADRFARAASDAADKQQAEEALWLAIVSLDRASRSSGGGTVNTRLDELVTLFVRQYPQTERAASLLIRRDSAGGIDDEQAIAVLLGVPAESPVYVNARRQAARVLYHRVFRGAPASGRASAATRFMKVAEEVLSADKRIAMEGGRAEAAEAADRVVLITRQMLDAILSLPAPDVARAELAIDTLRTVVAHNSADISKIEPELKFRRFQILLAKDDIAGAEKICDELRATGDRLADSADRELYKRAVNKWKKAGGGIARDEGIPADPWLKTHAASVLKLGTRLIDTMGSGPGALKDLAIQTVYRQVAQAGADLWDVEKIVAARDQALRLDRALLEAAKAENAPPPSESLMRIAVLAEAAGDAPASLEAWRTLAAGLRPGSNEWFRAKYNAARLLADSDPAKAFELLSQVAVLYPDLGSEPWRSKLKDLRSKLQSAQKPSPATSAPATTPSNGAAPAPGGGR